MKQKQTESREKHKINGAKKKRTNIAATPQGGMGTEGTAQLGKFELKGFKVHRKCTCRCGFRVG